MKKLREVKEAGQRHASCFCAEDEMETAVIEVRVSEGCGERAFREDVFHRVGDRWCEVFRE